MLTTILLSVEPHRVVEFEFLQQRAHFLVKARGSVAAPCAVPRLVRRAAPENPQPFLSLSRAIASLQLSLTVSDCRNRYWL